MVVMLVFVSLRMQWHAQHEIDDGNANEEANKARWMKSKIIE